MCLICSQKKKKKTITCSSFVWVIMSIFCLSTLFGISTIEGVFWFGKDKGS